MGGLDSFIFVIVDELSTEKEGFLRRKLQNPFVFPFKVFLIWYFYPHFQVFIGGQPVFIHRYPHFSPKNTFCVYTAKMYNRIFRALSGTFDKL